MVIHYPVIFCGRYNIEYQNVWLMSIIIQKMFSPELQGFVNNQLKEEVYLVKKEEVSKTDFILHKAI